ncbi:ABC transporter ATPase [Devosia yakushimensis]|uniref:ABC transporter ATPase n=1 Tax=Devosia yakushimensis TaxID=470028 RepID=A0ABQ5UBF7_9HYPH|nr:ABC transporter ATP-binding protein [Devosia yakushimensis]GLQ08766.1 ABC transporter ATPase [Devosia yakushimensis]
MIDDVPQQTVSADSVATAPRITLRGVSKTFGNQKEGGGTLALNNVDLTVRDGAFVSLLGPSGCGKTTILRMVNGLIAPDTGSVTVSGRTPAPGPEMGFVFQSFRLIPWSSVRGNVEFALVETIPDRSERRARAERYIELVGLQRFADAYPSELSGGMKQRVALARALASEPDILLLDEPFASIDAQTRELMQIELMRLWTVRKSVALFVTHSVDEAILLSDQIVLMGPRPGRVLEVIDVGLERPRWTYDVRAEPRFIELRSYLWDRIRTLVLTDPQSDFYGRDLGANI